MTRKRDLHDEAIAMLREQVVALKKSLRLREGQLRSAEAAVAAETAKTTGMQKVLVAHWCSISLLASVVGNEKRADRDARVGARRSLERVGVRPPASLGVSRPGSKKRATKKKVKPTTAGG